MTSLPIQHTVLERLLRYVVIDTQSDPASPTCPSTEKQKDLGRLLARELKEMGARRCASGRARLRLRDHPGDHVEEGAGDLLLLAHGHLARLLGQGRQAADRKELSGRRHRAAGGQEPGHSRQRAPGAGRPDRQRHRHHRRHHAARRRQQGRRRRDHGCGEIPDRQPADQARRHQDPVHAGRGDRPRRRQGGLEEARRGFRLHHRRRDRRPPRGRDLLGRRRHDRHRRRLHPSGLRQGQDGARDQDRLAPSSMRCRRTPVHPRPPKSARDFCIRPASPARWRARRST